MQLQTLWESFDGAQDERNHIDIPWSVAVHAEQCRSIPRAV